MNTTKNALFRHYRPIDFHEFVGQKNIITILTNQIKTNNFSQAILFTGPHGCGKTSLARIFAKAINCEVNHIGKQSDAVVPCNRCSHCLAVQENKALNIIELDGASNNGVEEIRHLIENSRLAPLGVPYKVFIIDEVHMLSKGAFNALLKTLEEPPRHAIFILATTEFDKIPTTIVSRCQTFNLHKINGPEMIDRLMMIAKEEGINLEPEAAQEIFNLSEGSLRDGLNILQQLLATEPKVVNLALVQEYFHTPTKEDKISILRHLLNQDPQSLIATFEKLHHRGLNLDLFILGLLEIIKEILAFNLTKKTEFLRNVNVSEITSLAANVEDLFVIGDALTAAYQRSNQLANDYNYVLINLLRALQNLSPKLPPNPQTHSVGKTKLEGIRFEDFLAKREKLLSQPRDAKAHLWPEEQIFNLLIAPSKERRLQVVEELNRVFAKDQDQQLSHPDQAEAFMSWYGGDIVATSDCEILIRFEHEEELKCFQEELQKPQQQQLIKTHFKHPYVVYGIERHYWEIIKREFIVVKKRGLLSHKHMTWETAYQNDQKTTPKAKDGEFIALANHLFGDLVEIEEGDRANK